MRTKNTELYANFRSARKIAKNAYEKSYQQISQLKVHFLDFYLYIALVFCI